MQQRRKDKRRKDFTHKHRNAHDQQDQEADPSDRTEESTAVTKYETQVPEDKNNIKSGLNANDSLSKKAKESEEKPVVDFSNLKRETEEIEKLKKKNQYEISSNWERYEGSGNKESLVYHIEEPADLLQILQSPSSHGGHFLLKEEQDWADASRIRLSGCFALDLKSLSQALSCIPFHVRHELPETIFSAEEMEQMTYGLTKRRELYFKSVKEETLTDKNKKSISENTCVTNISKEDSNKTSVKQADFPCLDDSIIHRGNKNGNISNIESFYDNVVEKNNTFSLGTSLESTVTLPNVDQFPVKKEIVEGSAATMMDRKFSNEAEVKCVKNSPPVPVIAFETYDSHSNAMRECRTPEKTVYSDRSSVNEKKEKTDSSVPMFNSSTTDIERESTKVPSDSPFIKECKNRTVSSESVPISSTMKNNKAGDTLQKTAQKQDSATDDFDFLLSFQDPVKRPSSVSIHETPSSGTASMVAPKVTAPVNKIEKDESLEDWLDSVLNG